MKTKLFFSICADSLVVNQKDFNMSTHEISALYEKALNLKVKGVDKLVVELSETRDYLFNPPVKMFPIVIITKKFDFDLYWKATENERKTIVLETLQESVLDMCEKMNLDKTPFEAAYREVIEQIL